MTPDRIWGFGAALIALQIGWAIWRRRAARDIAERWLSQHHYRVRRLRPVYWSMRPAFRLTPFRNNDWAVDYRAEVDDMRLGGSGEVRLRVWTDWLGMIDREPEISWVRMPTLDNAGAPTPEMQWESAQMAVLRRVATGESTLRPAGRDAAARVEFDTLVEHVLALNRRGLVTCATPIAELRADAQYAAVTDVALTAEGRQALARADASSAAAPD